MLEWKPLIPNQERDFMIEYNALLRFPNSKSGSILARPEYDEELRILTAAATPQTEQTGTHERSEHPENPKIAKNAANASPCSRDMKAPLTPSSRKVLMAMISIAFLVGLAVSSLSAEDREAPVLTEGDRATPVTSSKATTKPGPQRANQLALLAIMKIMNQMPQDIRPTASGWDKLKFPKAAEWFNDYARGKTIETPALLNNVSTRYRGKDKYEITVRYQFHWPAFSFSGFPMQFVPNVHLMRRRTPSIGDSYVEKTYLGDEACARRWSNTPKGTPVFVQGIISATSLIMEQRMLCCLTITNMKFSSKATLSTEERAEATLSTEKRAEETSGVSSLLAVLNRMPKDLLPDPKRGWDALTLPKVNEWLARFAQRKPFQGQLALGQCYVRHIKKDTYHSRVTLEMVPDARIIFRKQTLWLRMTRIHAAPNDRWGDTDLTKVYTVNQAKAEKWREEPVGKRFDIGGQIVAAALKPAYSGGVRVEHGYVFLFRVLVATVSEHKVERRVAQKPQPTAKSPSVKAESRIQFAKTYLSSGMKEKAVPILKEIIKKYPNTEAASEAKKLLRDAE